MKNGKSTTTTTTTVRAPSSTELAHAIMLFTPPSTALGSSRRRVFPDEAQRKKHGGIPLKTVQLHAKLRGSRAEIATLRNLRSENGE